MSCAATVLQREHTVGEKNYLKSVMLFKFDIQHAFVWPEQKVSRETGILSTQGSQQYCNTNTDTELHAQRQKVSTSNYISVTCSSMPTS